MNKSLLNIAVTMTLSSAVFSGSVLSTQAYADDLTSDDVFSNNHAFNEQVITDNNSSNDNTTENYMVPGMGVGAASGALIAGPVGLLVGGAIGAILGSNQGVSTEPETITALAENTTEKQSPVSAKTQNDLNKNNSIAEPAEQTTALHGIQVAQLGTNHTIVDDSIDSQQDTLIDILTGDLSLDIYFRSGSTDIESFYPARLAAIAGLMNTMDKLELHLDGYTDRRGNKDQNITLANKRLENVRQQLINAGVEENRILSKAFGEMDMVSRAGDLEAYTFDRKVVIRFERTGPDSIASMATALSGFATEETAISKNEESPGSL